MKDAMVIAIKHREIEDKVFANRCGVSLAKHYSMKLGVATVIVVVGAAMVAVPDVAVAVGAVGAAIAVAGISVATRTAGVLLESAINKGDQNVDPATRYSISVKLQAMRDEHDKSKASGPSTPPAFA